MNVEREIAGFALPFAAGVLVTAYAESLFCGDFPSINFYALLLIFMAVIPLLKSSDFNRRGLVPWILTGAAALGCGVLSAATSLSLTDMPMSAFSSSCREIGIWLQEQIDCIPFSSKDTSSLVKALLTGEKSSLSYEIRSAFRDSGASHILALSGLHLGIIYGILSKTTAVLGNTRRMRAARSIFIICICGIYTLATGAGDSLVRAYIFIILRELAKMTSRYHGLGQVLLASLVVQLTIDPLAVRSISFQLSYAAMAGIAFIYPWLQGFWDRAIKLIQNIKSEEDSNDKTPAEMVSKAMQWVWNTVALSIACQITTGPLAYAYFGTFPVNFMLTNLLSLPLTGLLIPCALLTVVLSTLGCCPQILIQATEWLVSTLVWMLKVISTM